MEVFDRSLYYKQIHPFIGKNLIKVITGQRRVGKSFFLRQVLNEIVRKEKETQIIYINKERRNNNPNITKRNIIIMNIRIRSKLK